jgi:hypothetical protein
MMLASAIVWMDFRVALDRALMAYSVVHPNGPSPSPSHCIVSEGMKLVQLNQGPGNEICRFTFDEIDRVLEGQDLESLRTDVASQVTTESLARPYGQKVALPGESRYKVTCLRMSKYVDRQALQDCLDENSRIGWTLKSITKVDTFSVTKEVISGHQTGFELVVVFERG